MKKYQGVAITDGVNRKNHMVLFSTIIKSYHGSWNSIIPMNLGHDSTKQIGYSMLTGIYMEPGKAYVTNESAIMETKEEYDKMVKAYDCKIFCEEHKKELNILIEKLRFVLSDKYCVAPFYQAVAIKDKDIVYRLFPEWSKTIKDGLVDARELEPICTKKENGKKEILVPGVYYKEGHLLFAHQFFRRSLSILNTTNGEFFNSFEKMRDISTVKMKLALDMDMVGLIGTEQPEIEYQYIRGPHFNDDLTCIPEGVTCHENEHYDNVYSNLLSTQFFLHMQDGKRTFECEELCDKENITLGDGQTILWGCRYVHSMINPKTGLPTHLDGAIRIYNDEQILARIDSKTDISKCGKNSKYIKLWRIDNDFNVAMWKEIISSFYRENALIGEYFGGIDEKYDQIKNKVDEHNTVVKHLNNFAHIELNEGDGIRIYFRYKSKFDIVADRDIEIYNKDLFILQDGRKVEILDADTVTILKYLKRKGLSLQMPITSLIAFEDMILNFPTLCCKSLQVADVVITAIKELCQAWVKKQDDRLVSFGFMVNLVDEAVHISLAGHVKDFEKLFNVIPKLSDLAFEEWIETLYQENNKFKLGGDYPDKFQLIHNDVVCFKRIIVNPNKIRKLWVENEGVHAQFYMTKEEENELSQHKIICAPFYKIHQNQCSNCGKDYIQCSCVKFIDENVFNEVAKADLLGLIWTNRNASYTSGNFEFFHKD